MVSPLSAALSCSTTAASSSLSAPAEESATQPCARQQERFELSTKGQQIECTHLALLDEVVALQVEVRPDDLTHREHQAGPNGSASRPTH
jgi:hypothetical protein